GFGEWGDYDNDGYSDILFGGRDSTGAATTLVYRNEGNGNFTEVQAGLIGLTSGAGAWGDYDNDGDLDIAITGAQNISPPYHPVTKLYRNDGNDRFMPVMIPLTGLRESSLAWGDFNNDQRLDLIVSGLDSNDHLKTHIYRNNFGSFNTRPLSPQGLTASVAGDTVHLSWNAATDNETPSPALTYNLRMGTTPGGTDIISPMADPSTGYRYQVAQGNAHHDTVWYIYNLSSGTYYWSVQAIDQSFAGSEFATENSFVVNNTGIPNNKDPVPQKFALLQNYPNPFNPQTRIQFTLPKATEINLTIYNMLGQPVRTLAKGRRSAGVHEILWDGNNTRGDPAPSGIYMYRLKTKREVQTRKMLLVR
ncbi:MAG: T9SS type A sorting domain-containing protein, partial [Gammaproteobacteria bacterium]|nr:T9SS type A sorting domain-containing protein [Gammaproteobacteria bacterium]NIW47006.1 T9SS type A sorting domain-containing protein [Gammaproteobacteria bacterium]NIX57993.1 T9SS type A sorting domain-containing protein [candidate division Zixibacteria bacterium]